MEYNLENLDTFFNDNNVVELSQHTMDKLYKCENYNEVIKIIGKANQWQSPAFL